MHFYYRVFCVSLVFVIDFFPIMYGVNMLIFAKVQNSEKYLQVQCWIKTILTHHVYEEIFIRGDCQLDINDFAKKLCKNTKKITMMKSGKNYTCSGEYSFLLLNIHR